MSIQTHAKNNEGFTLIELLVGLSIIVIMSAIVAVRFDSLRSSTALDGDAEHLSATIRQTQLWALTGQTRTGVRPAGGWGVYMEECTVPSCSYFIFADVYPADSPNHTYDPGLDETMEDIQFDDAVFINTVTPNGAGGSLDVVFSIPDATAYVNGSQVSGEASIILEHSGTGNTRTIRVDRVSGRINVE